MTRMKLFGLFLMSIGIHCPAQAIMSGNVLNFGSGGDMINNGTYSAKTLIKLKCGGTFSGKGLCEAPAIEIFATRFEFSGTIKCDGRCCITVQEPFNEKMFTRIGKGEFIITVDPQLKMGKDDQEIEDRFKKHTSINPATKDLPIINKQESASFQPSPVVVSRDEYVIEKQGIEFSVRGKAYIELAKSIEKGDCEQAKKMLHNNREHIKSDKKQLNLFMLMAGFYGHKSIAQECIRLGADGTVYNQFVLDAAVNDNETLLAALLQAGANPNAMDARGKTALMYASEQLYLKAVTLLLSSSADAQRRDKKGYTAFDYVYEQDSYVGSADRKKILQLLDPKGWQRFKKITIVAAGCCIVLGIGMYGYMQHDQ